MSYIITVDVGTTSVKTCIFDQNYKRLASCTEEYELMTPRENFVESAPSVYIAASAAAISSLVRKVGASGGEIAAISVTSQGETLIPVSRERKALRNGIVWLDSRASKQADFLAAKLEKDEYYRMSGLPEPGGADPIAKVMWLRENEPDCYKNTYKFMLIADYICMTLSGNFTTDNIMQCSTGWFDIVKGAYSDRMLSLSGIDREKLPEVRPAGSVVGYVQPQTARALGVSEKTAVVAGGMDQVASALGSGNYRPGIVTETTGTALVIASSIEKPDFDSGRKIPIYPHFGGRYLLLPFCPCAAIVQKWFKEQFCSELVEAQKCGGKTVYAALDELAAGVPAGAGGLITLPSFEGRLTPTPNAAAKGAFFGVTLETKKAHFARSIMEGVAFMLRENLEFMAECGVAAKEVRSMGGGSNSEIWNKIKAAVTGCPIETLAEPETTSLGCYMAAAVALGREESFGQASERALVKKRFVEEANPALERAYEKYLALQKALDPLF